MSPKKTQKNFTWAPEVTQKRIGRSRREIQRENSSMPGREKQYLRTRLIK